MSPRLEFAIDAVLRAGRSTLATYQKLSVVDRKSDNSPVTVADRAAESQLRAEIAAAFPEDGILGEEEGETGDRMRRWVLDPIDGTKSFVAGVPLYATLMAFEVDDIPQIGVCYFPALDELIYAERGQGCVWNGTACHVSTKVELADSFVATGGLQTLAKTDCLAGVVRLGRACLATRTWCDAYGHALVATGRVEAMIDPLVSRWDISAMAVIVEEAGGRWSGLDGSAGLHDSALSSNGLLHERVLEELRG